MRRRIAIFNAQALAITIGLFFVYQAVHFKFKASVVMKHHMSEDVYIKIFL